LRILFVHGDTKAARFRSDARDRADRPAEDGVTDETGAVSFLTSIRARW
jgi:hypothetical protein